jgi:type IV pilus assembly protein PilX
MKPTSTLRSRQAGISLVIVLVLLIAAVFLGVSAGVIALQSEKSSRIDRDRQIAFQAAEAALVDAQLDIDGSRSGTSPNVRAIPFSQDSALAFPGDDESESCGALTSGSTFGLCRLPLSNGKATWLQVNLADASATTRSVEYGHYTGQRFPVSSATLPAALPRYIIELIAFNQAGQSAEAGAQTFAYRITAIGFGADPKTRVVLQAVYRKES